MFDQPPDDPNPTYRRKRTSDFNAPKPNEMAARQEEQLRALAQIQNDRPLKPPRVKR